MPDIVSVEYQQTGNSTSTNPYGMREMQERAFEYRDANYIGHNYFLLRVLFSLAKRVSLSFSS